MSPSTTTRPESITRSSLYIHIYIYTRPRRKRAENRDSCSALRPWIDRYHDIPSIVQRIYRNIFALCDFLDFFFFFFFRPSLPTLLTLFSPRFLLFFGARIRISERARKNCYPRIRINYRIVRAIICQSSQLSTIEWGWRYWTNTWKKIKFGVSFEFYRDNSKRGGRVIYVYTRL